MIDAHMTMKRTARLLVFWLKTSRPGLYFQWLWLYLLPVAGTDAHTSPVFWGGLAFATLPLSLLVYGWNDLVRVAEAVQNRGAFHIALSGGSTPEPFYIRLVIDPRYRALPWDKIHVWMVDERRVPEDNEKSNWRMIRESLLDHVDAPLDHLHPMPVMHDDPASEYEASLRSVFGDVGMPRMDVILLGMGDDCHTASLFPQSAAIDVRDRWITVNEGEHVTPPDRVTMTYPLINAARHIGVLVVGSKKNVPLRRVSDQMQTGPDPTHVPISGIAPEADGDMVWYLDPAAAGI